MPLTATAPAAAPDVLDIVNLLRALVRRLVRSRPVLARHGDDLLGEALLVAVKCARRFRPTAGAKLSTFASVSVERRLRTVAREVGAIIHAPQFPIDPAAAARARRIVSLDAPVPGRRDSRREPESFGAGIAAAEDGADAERQVLARFEVAELLSCLSARERTIIVRRFGLDGGPAATLDEIAAPWGLSRERVRQLETAAMRRLSVYARETAPAEAVAGRERSPRAERGQPDDG